MRLTTPESHRAAQLAQVRLSLLLARAGVLTADHIGQGHSMLTRYHLSGVLLTAFHNHTASRHYDRVIALIAETLRYSTPPHPSPLREANLIWMAVRRTYPSSGRANPLSKPPTAVPEILSGGKSKEVSDGRQTG